MSRIVTRSSWEGEENPQQVLQQYVEASSGRWRTRFAAVPLVLSLLVGCSLSGTQPVGFQDRVNVAERMLLSGQHEGAYRLLDGVMSGYGETSAAKIAVGDTYIKTRLFMRSERAYRAAIASGALDEGEVGLGRVSLARNSPDRAIGYFNAVLERDPANLDAINGLGVAFDLKGQHTQARTFYNSVLSSDPAHLAALNNLALSNALSGSGETSASLLRDLTESNLSDRTIRQNFAIALYLIGRKSDAERLALADLDSKTANVLFKAILRYRRAHP